MGLTVVTATTGLIVLLVILELLRRRQLREKYGVLWLGVCLLIIPLALYPRLLDSVAHTFGVAYGVSLVLFLSTVFLLLVCVHLSWEVSRLEERARTLAEGLALLRVEIGKSVSDQPPAHPSVGQRDTQVSGTAVTGAPVSGTAVTGAPSGSRGAVVGGGEPQ